MKGQPTILAVNAEKVLGVPLDVRVDAGDVPAVGAVRRVRALYALGHLNYVIAREAGISRDAVCSLAAGHWATVKVSVDDGVRAAYDRLSMSTGESWKTRRMAERHGWVPPLAWDDDTIDDPEARPELNSGEVSSRGEGAEHVDRVAVEAYLAGRIVQVTDAERLAALLAAPGRDLSMGDVDALHGLPQKASENFLRRMKMRYARAGLALPDVGAEVVVLPPLKRSAVRNRIDLGEAA